MAQLTLTTAEAADSTGVSSAWLDKIARAGIVEPAQPASGTGTARRWTLEDLAAVAVVALLRKLGVPFDALRGIQRIVEGAYADDPTGLAGAWLVVSLGDGAEMSDATAREAIARARLVRDPAEAIAAGASRLSAVVDLGDLEWKLRDELRALAVDVERERAAKPSRRGARVA